MRTTLQEMNCEDWKWMKLAYIYVTAVSGIGGVEPSKF
jgi:hypothetical protein